MALSRLELKIISIIQLVMSIFLYALGIVDHFKVRYTYLSHLLMPCWIAALVTTLAQDIELRVFHCLRSCFWQLWYEKFEVHGEDIKLFLLVLLFVSIIRLLRLNFTQPSQLPFIRECRLIMALNIRELTISATRYGFHKANTNIFTAAKVR